MTLRRPTKAVIAAAFATGLLTVVLAVMSLLRRPFPDADQLVLFVTLSVLIGATWVRPLVIYRNEQSEAVNVDEGFFVIMALLLPGTAAIMAFVLATIVAQVVLRRHPVKSLFNWGQFVVSAGVGVLVEHALAPPTPRLTIAELAAAALGTAVFAVVNCAAMGVLVASLGTPWRRTMDGMGIRARLVGASIVVGMMTSLAISAYRWSLPLAVLTLLVLRQVLAGHFQARHDRTRLLGLFEAALSANRSLGEGEVHDAVLDSARHLLRCSDAAIRTSAPGGDELAAPMLVNGEPCWLAVSGRSHTEPFDSADRALLEALGAVGAGALTNGERYREGVFQRERLAAITESLGEGVCALDTSGRVTFFNPAAARMLGWEGPDPAATPEFLEASGFEAMRRRETVRNDGVDFPCSDGSALPLALTASAILADNEVAGAVVVFRDISERREVETAIRVARDKAIEASRLKSQFLANMSHEIRTPMNGVLVMSRMLLGTNLDDAQRKYLHVIRDSGENLMVIIDDILDFSKIEAGKLELEEVDFDLVASLVGVTNAMTFPARNKGLDLRLDIDPGVPEAVRGDPVRLRQVLTNLVGNAVKFTHAGSITIRACEMGEGRVRVAVSDTGIGIAPAARATVFDAFGQADSSTTRRYGGTGLGLAICSQLISMMGGVLDFESQPGRGSTFWFEVPFAEAFDPAAPVSTAAVGPPLTAPAARPRVLLADDGPVDRFVASLALERLGYHVDVVASGEEVVAAVQRHRYHAVLMDCRMPVMDGFEATRRVRRLGGAAGATPIIAMTASVFGDEQEQCLTAGMNDYLSKPLDAGRLAQALWDARTEVVSV